MLSIIFIRYVSFLYATYHFYICTVNFPPFEQHVWEVSPESGSVLTKCTDPDTTQKFSMCRNKFSFWKGCKKFFYYFLNNSFNNTNFFIFLFLNFDNKHFVIRICLRYFLQQKLCEFTYIYVLHNALKRILFLTKIQHVMIFFHERGLLIYQLD